MATRRTSRGATLTRDIIVAAAADVFQRDGLEGLTARKLAVELGVSQMAVYRHFRSLAELHGHLVDRVVQLHTPAMTGEGHWADWLHETFCSFRRVLLEHPGILPLLGTTAYVGENALMVVEQVLDVLHRAGFGADDAATAFHALISYTIGASTIEHVALASIRAATGEGAADSPWAPLVEQLSNPDAQRFRQVRAHALELARFASDERFEQGLRVIVAGLRDKLEASARRTSGGGGGSATPAG